jgi:hypothetical protein
MKTQDSKMITKPVDYILLFLFVRLIAWKSGLDHIGCRSSEENHSINGIAKDAAP